jgi:osmoprotectant transport system substrate-binding protein
MQRFQRLLGLVVITLAQLVSSYAGAATEGEVTKGPITIGSKIDTEGALLSQIIILMLKDNGFEVIDKSQFRPTAGA